MGFHCHHPAANTAAVISDSGSGLADITETSFKLGTIRWSYSGAPTGGKLTIAIDGTTVDEIDITAGGPGVYSFGFPVPVAWSSSFSITLAAGGAGVTGKLNTVIG